MSEVLPCPLCGRTADIEVGSEKVYKRAFPDGGGCVSITCRHCWISVTAHAEIDIPIEPSYEKLKEQAIIKWDSIKR